MAKKPTMKKAGKKGRGTGESMIISKSRTKATASKCNVSSDFYGALDQKVREMIKNAEGRALGNKRKTLRPYDL